MDALRRVLMTGTAATSDEHAREASEDAQVAAFDNRATPTVLRLQVRGGQ